MKLLFVILFSIVLMTPLASAQAVPAKTFHFGITPERAIAAAPRLEWSKNDWGDEGGPLDGAFAYDAAELGGYTWDVTIGEKYGPAESGGALIMLREKGKVRFQREFAYEHPDDCAMAMSDTAAVLEPDYGPFGADEDFFNPNSTRYLSKGYRRMQAGPKSLMREYRDDYGPSAWETFGKAVGKEHEAWIWGKRFDADKVCYLEITLRLPFRRLEKK